jgi:hypothetical protein
MTSPARASGKDADVALILAERRRAKVERAIHAVLQRELPRPTGDDGHHAAAVHQAIGALVDVSLEGTGRGTYGGLVSRPADLVETLLGDGPVDPGELSYEIDDRWHLGVVATSTRAEEALESVGRDLGYTAWVVTRGDATLWAWFGGATPLPSADVAHAVTVQMPAGVRLAAGEPGRGLNGWRTTHRQARTALGVSGHHGQPVTRFADVALVASLRDSAEILTSLYLSPLNKHRKSKELRETLRAYFNTGHNASCAGKAVGVHTRTVRRRVKWTEKALGRQIQAVAAELDIALRLEALHTNDTPQPSSSDGDRS